jgi:hypothetical protein
MSTLLQESIFKNAMQLFAGLEKGTYICRVNSLLTM